MPDDVNGARDIFVRDTVDGTTTLVSSGSAPTTRGSYYPAISADGSLVVFSTDGALVNDDTNARSDVTARGLANAYAQTLGSIFTDAHKPYEVELVVAEVGATSAEDQI